MSCSWPSPLLCPLPLRSSPPHPANLPFAFGLFRPPLYSRAVLRSISPVGGPPPLFPPAPGVLPPPTRRPPLSLLVSPARLYIRGQCCGPDCHSQSVEMRRVSVGLPAPQSGVSVCRGWRGVVA